MNVAHTTAEMSVTSSPGSSSLAASLRADLDRYREFHRRSGRTVSTRRLLLESLLLKAGFQAVVLYRFSRWLHERGLTWPAWVVARLNLWATGADLEFGARIGPGLLIPHPAGIVIGRGTVMGADATVFQGVTCGIRGWAMGPASAYPVLGDRVVLFVRCSVLGGVRIGSRVVIGAHALVTHDVPTGALAAGAPAQVHTRRGDALLRAWGL